MADPPTGIHWASTADGFRAQLGEWISAHVPNGLAEAADWGAPLLPGGLNDELRDIEAAQQSAAYREWEDALRGAGLICAQWPALYGGAGLSPLQVSILEEVFAQVGVPRVRRALGETLVGPAILQHGTEAQRAHFLPRIIQGTDTYCQGFSEPDAGSDLAAVRTRGVVDGDGVVVTGHKTWTTWGDRATMMFVLCRTDPSQVRHRGLSYVLVPMRDNNISVRPIRAITGASDFAEEFLDGARAPLFNVIGGLGNGWRVAMTTLNHERSYRASTQHLGYQRQFAELLTLAERRGLLHDPVYRQRFAWALMQIELMRFTGVRVRGELADGGTPGPWASTTKLVWSEFHERLGELFMDVAGPEGVVLPPGDGFHTTRAQDIYLAGRAGTTYSGSSEVQRNIIAEKILGMPR